MESTVYVLELVQFYDVIFNTLGNDDYRVSFLFRPIVVTIDGSSNGNIRFSECKGIGNSRITVLDSRKAWSESEEALLF